MCHNSVISFGERVLTWTLVDGKDILEVGSMDINGSLRAICKRQNCKSYLGVDLNEGPGVDQIVSALDLMDKFGENSFDIVIATELLEHVNDWRAVINNIKTVCKPGGSILITTRSPGFPLHLYPDDFWRFTLDDFCVMFKDFEIKLLASDEQVPGVFVFAEKPFNFLNTDLLDLSVINPAPAGK